MYNQPDPFQDVLRELEASIHRAKETGDPFAPAPKPGSGAQPKCEEAQAFNPVAAAAAIELLKAQKAMQAYPYTDEGTRVVKPVYINPRMTAAEGLNFSKVPELKTPQSVIDALEKVGIKEPGRYIDETVVFSDGRILERTSLNRLEADLNESIRRADLLREEIMRLKDTIGNWEWAAREFRRAHLAGSISASGAARNRLFDMLPPAEKQQSSPQQTETKDAPPTLHIEWTGVKLMLTTE